MSTWKKTADVVIIGGGIVGVSTAFFLSLYPSLRIVLLEKQGLVQATTGLSVGGIRQQFSHPANIRLSQKTLAFFDSFERESGASLGFRKVGYLFLAQKPETWTDFLASVKIQKSLQVPVEILSPDDLKKRWPYLHVEDLLGGTFGPDDGFADPYQVTMALARAARKRGIHFFERTEATGLLLEGGKITGVKTPLGRISTPAVVNAAGPWAGQVGQMAGRTYPVLPYRRQVFVTKAFDSVPRPIPLILDFDSLFYFREEGPAVLMGRSDPQEPPGFNTAVDRNFMETVIEAACHRAPVLGEAKISKGWGGLYTITPDENPIIGPDPQMQGLFNAIGFSGHGFQHGPAVGEILAGLITGGDTSFDLSPFSLDRFKGGSREGEKRVV